MGTRSRVQIPIAHCAKDDGKHGSCASASPPATQPGHISAWLSQLPAPVAIEIFTSTDGIKIRLYTPPERALGAVYAWASMTHQQSRWEKIPTDPQTHQLPVVALRTRSRIPNLVMGDLNADPMLAIGGQLRTGLQPGQQASMRIWLLGKEKHLQERLRTLVSYSYGTESGVSDKGTPIPGEYHLVSYELF